MSAQERGLAGQGRVGVGPHPTSTPGPVQPQPRFCSTAQVFPKGSLGDPCSDLRPLLYPLPPPAPTVARPLRLALATPSCLHCQGPAPRGSPCAVPTLPLFSGRLTDSAQWLPSTQRPWHGRFLPASSHTRAGLPGPPWRPPGRRGGSPPRWGCLAGKAKATSGFPFYDRRLLLGEEQPANNGGQLLPWGETSTKLAAGLGSPRPGATEDSTGVQQCRGSAAPHPQGGMVTEEPGGWQRAGLRLPLSASCWALGGGDPRASPTPDLSAQPGRDRPRGHQGGAVGPS